MCPPLRFSRCPYHHIGFCRNVLLSDDNRRAYVVSYRLCRNEHQVTVYYKFFGDHNLQTYVSPPQNVEQYTTLNRLLNLPYSHIYLFSNYYNVHLANKHKKEWISQMNYIFKIFLSKKQLIKMSLSCLTTICFALFTTLALIVRLHLICMYTVINLMTSLRLFCPQLWILLFYTSC